RMILHRAEDPQLHIGQRTDRERNAPGHQIFDQRWILEHRTPWSMRETRNSASASPMYDGAPSSPACATVRNPSCRARAKTAVNFDGGLPTSAESSPTATIRSLYGNASSSVCMADSALRCRRKQ